MRGPLCHTALLRAHPALQELRRELNLLRNFAVSFGLLSMLTGEERGLHPHPRKSAALGCCCGVLAGV